ncbi:MAG: hypothetical protein M0Z84_10350 [Gammaproteobacteria bacterium]|nr:hypothetical protein [Gammaproteobacteria bacterium]
MREPTVTTLSLPGLAHVTETAAAPEIPNLVSGFAAALELSTGTHRGLCVRTLGDAAYLVHGLDRNGAALNACQTAVDLAQRIRPLPGRSPHGQLPAFDADIRISTGKAVAGEMAGGFEIIGEPAGLLTRLNALNAVYGTHLLLDEPTRRAVNDRYPASREIDLIQIRGHAEAFRIFEMMLPHYLDPGWLPEFSRGYELFFAGLRPQARRIFEHLADEVDDPVSRVLLARCAGPRRRLGD